MPLSPGSIAIAILIFLIGYGLCGYCQRFKARRSGDRRKGIDRRQRTETPDVKYGRSEDSDER